MERLLEKTSRWWKSTATWRRDPIGVMCDHDINIERTVHRTLKICIPIAGFVMATAIASGVAK